MEQKTRSRLIAFYIGLTLMAGVVFGVALDRLVLSAFVPLDNIPAEAESRFSLMAEAWNIIDQYYVDRPAVDPKELTYGAISGMVDALGDTGHSQFLSPEELASLHDFTDEQYKGIGAEVRMRDSQVVIVAPLDGSPAQAAGIRPGDVILMVDGQDIADLPLDKVIERILGPVGTKVTLSLLSPDTERVREVTIERAVINVRNVTWQLLPGTSTAHLRVSGFSQNVVRDVQQALGQIQKEPIKGIILDLRNNTGGLLTEAVGLAGEFLGRVNVVLIKNADGEITPMTAKDEGAMATTVPVVVLINKGTASGAEIVAGAIQDHGRGPLVGETTFGTGTVLSEFSLTDGSALLLAIEEWLTPKGRTIWHKGINPDHQVKLSHEVDPLFPVDERSMTPDALSASKDVQLLRAISLLEEKRRSR